MDGWPPAESSLVNVKLTTPRLRLEIQEPETGYGRISTEKVSPQSLSPSDPHYPPDPTTPTTPHDKSSPTAHLAKATSSRIPHHAIEESRKLLALVLHQLDARMRPPTVLETSGYSSGEVPQKTFSKVIKTLKSAPPISSSTSQSSKSKDDNGDEEEDDAIFSSEATYDLTHRLREILSFAAAQGWKILEEEMSSLGDHHGSLNRGSSSPFRFRSSSRRNSSTEERNRSQSPEHRLQHSELFAHCLSVLSSVVLEDCRFKIASPRPSKPPFALQSVTLDVTRYMILLHSDEHDTVTRIASVLLPAFSTFPREMQPSLVAFFEQIVVRRVFEGLEATAGDARSKEQQYESLPRQSLAPSVSIHVDEAPSDNLGSLGSDWQPWHLPDIDRPPLGSFAAPFHPYPVYVISSLAAPLLAALLDTVDIGSVNALTLYRVNRLVRAIIDEKRDVYLNLLEVVAYHNSKSRHMALTLLSTFWPQALGHNTVAQPFPALAGSKSEMEKASNLRDHPYAHEFVIWRFQRRAPAVFEDHGLHICHMCSTAIDNMGLFCGGCMCAVHFDCYEYPQGNVVTEYVSDKASYTRKVAVYRFCLVPSLLQTPIPEPQSRQDHLMELVNIFTLTLCSACQMPIWGVQALHCSCCRCFIHTSCRSSASNALSSCNSFERDASHVVTQLSTVRQSFADFYSDIFLSSEDLGRRTYEEISVSFGVLWMQLQILNNGLALGSIIIESDEHGSANDASGFELQYLVELYEAYLSSGKLPVSAILGEFLQESKLQPSKHALMFDWSTLAYIASCIRSPFEAQAPSFSSPGGFLSASRAVSGEEGNSSDDREAFNIVTFAHARNVLGYEFNLFSDSAAVYCLSWLSSLGMFMSKDMDQLATPSFSQQKACELEFPLPLGFDLSIHVETLVCSIEASLSDLNLSANEAGFLLLLRRFWPSGMASEYALRRLTQAILKWVLAEDDNLVTILRDYVSRQRSLPGVRSATDPQSWPYDRDNRRVAVSSANNGGDYVASRRSLLNKYATPWLLALHDQDVGIYASMVYEALTSIAKDAEQSDIRTPAVLAETFTRYLVKLTSTSVLFSALDDIFFSLLERANPELYSHATVPSLPRLFTREIESGSRSSTADALQGIRLNTSSDFWPGILKAAASKRTYQRTLTWLQLLARSGVDISTSMFGEFVAFAQKHNAPMTDCLTLVEAMFATTWIRSLGRQDLQSKVSSLHVYVAQNLLAGLHSPEEIAEFCTFARKSLAVCLLLYGCGRSELSTLSLIDEADLKDLPSRRKLNTRISSAHDPIIMDVELLHVLESYVSIGIPEVVASIAKFIHGFFVHASLLESYEIDNYILRNGQALRSCVWGFYDIRDHNISSIRLSILVRILAVDPLPFQQLLADTFGTKSHWQERFFAMNRLFRMVLDMSSPLEVEDRQWRSSTLEIFYHCIGPLWADDSEEIRAASSSWIQTLLPAHLDAVSRCWNEAFPSIPITERLRLTSFLIHLQPHFPTWRVLSWETIIEALREDDYAESDRANDDGPAHAYLDMYGLSSKTNSQLRKKDSDTANVQNLLLVLAFRMLSSGVSIDLFSMFTLKFYLVKFVGFSDVSSTQAANGRALFVRFDSFSQLPEYAFPCIHEIPRLLDSSHPYDLPPSVMGGPSVEDDTPSTALVGTAFVDVALALFCSVDDPGSIPVLVQKSLLESMLIIVYKQDFQKPTLIPHDPTLRKAIRRTLDTMHSDLSYELRQTSLSIVQTYFQRWPSVLVIDAIEHAAAVIIALDSRDDDTLVVQTRGFLTVILTTFLPNGIFCSLCKRDLQDDIFIVLKDVTDAEARRATSSNMLLKEALLRSVLSQPPDADWKANNFSAKNICRYVQVVFYDGYDDALLREIGDWLTLMARRSSGRGFDVNLLLDIASVLIKHHAPPCQDFIQSVATVMRIALSRFEVRKDVLLEFLPVAGTNNTLAHHRRHARSTEVAEVILEVFDEVLRMKSRVSPSTLDAIAEAVLTIDPASLERVDWHYMLSITSLTAPGTLFLLQHGWSPSDSEKEFAAAMGIARLILRSQELKEKALPALSGNGEGLIHPVLYVRTWNILILAATSEPPERGHLLLFHFKSFAPMYYRSLDVFARAGAVPRDSALAEFEHACVALKLWLLLAHSASSIDGSSQQIAELTWMIWNELWPAIETLLDTFGVSGNGEDDFPFNSLLSSAVANLLIFLHQYHLITSLDLTPCIRLLQRQRDSARRSTVVNKLSRIVEGESFSEVQFSALRSQVAKDIISAEKLRALDREPQKVAGDRRRDREVRGAP